MTKSSNVFNDNGVQSVKTFKQAYGYSININWLNILLKPYGIQHDVVDGITLNLGPLIGNDSEHDVPLLPYDKIKSTYSTYQFRAMYDEIAKVLNSYVKQESKNVLVSDVVIGKHYPTNAKEREAVHVHTSIHVSHIIMDNGKVINGSLKSKTGIKVFNESLIATMFVTTPRIIKLLVDEYFKSKGVPSSTLKDKHLVEEDNNTYYSVELIKNALVESNGKYNSVIALRGGLQRIQR